MALNRTLRHGVLRLIMVLATSFVLTFGIDYGVFELRAVTGRNAYGSVLVRSYYAVAQKNGKTEFLFNPPAVWTCINSLFPHAGYPPCWYLERHPEQRTDI